MQAAWGALKEAIDTGLAEAVPGEPTGAGKGGRPRHGYRRLPAPGEEAA